MKKYEKYTPKKHKIEKWQLGAIIGGGSLFLVATIILIVLFAENIFTENVLVWCLVALVLAFLIGGVVFYFTCLNKKEY